MIDWMSPSEDVLTAKRVGYEEAEAKFAADIVELREQVDELEDDKSRLIILLNDVLSYAPKGYNERILAALEQTAAEHDKRA